MTGLLLPVACGLWAAAVAGMLAWLPSVVALRAVTSW